MSWWDTGAISGYATKALKKAQKGIDKVLDISEEGANSAESSPPKTDVVTASEDAPSTSSEKSAHGKSKLQEGSEFFNAWLSTPSPKPAQKEDKPADPPIKTRNLSGAKKLGVESRKTSSSSLSDTGSEVKDVKEFKDAKLLISSGSESAFKTVLSQDSLMATSDSSSMFEEIRVDPSKPDEDVFKQFDMTPEKKEDVRPKVNEYSPSLRVETKDIENESSSFSSTENKPAKAQRGALKLGKKVVVESMENISQVEQTDTSAKGKGDDLKVKIETETDIPVVTIKDESGSLESSGEYPDPFAGTDPAEAGDWGDMSLSLLTESQMSTMSSSTTSKSTEIEMVASQEIPSENVTKEEESEQEKVEDQQDTKESHVDVDVDEKVKEVKDFPAEDVNDDTLKSSVDEAPKDTSDHTKEMTATKEIPEVQPVEDTLTQSQEESTETPLTSGSKASVSTVEDVMEGSHESGELSDSNRTITAGDDQDDESDLDDDVDHSSDFTEPKDTDSNRDRSSSIQSITEPSTSPRSPESFRSGLSGEGQKEEMSSSGYVKNMLEEAMVESQKDTDSQYSSEIVRIESGRYSGHTSADESETQTSSDIEIISHISSTPTSNGEYRDRPFDLSPLRHTFGRGMFRTSGHSGHTRSDSGSSGMSFQSGNGHDLTSPPGLFRHPEPPMHSPMVSTTQTSSVAGGTQQQTGAEGGSNTNNPYETDKLLKDDGKLDTIDELTDPAEMMKKLAEMAETLDAREKKLVELSTENMELGETNSVLKNLLRQAEEARESDQTDLHALTEEFTKRIAEAEKRIHQSQKEKEAAKKRATELEMEVRNRSDTSTATERIIKEKDEQITELLEEGEKLSKQQLQSNNIIKKLRAKEKENDTTIKSQREKVDSQKAEIERLQKILDNKCDIEQKQIDAINQLNNMAKKQEKEIERLKTDVEEYQEKARSAQNALDSSYKEIAELHRAAAAAQSEQTQAALSAEMLAKQKIQAQLDNYTVQARNEKEALLTQIEDLRLSISRQEKEAGRREDLLRQEISDVHQRLQEGEERNHELTASVSGATRPLLRQIENLQHTYAAQSASYEKIEKNLTDRLAEVQQQASVAIAKERDAAEQLREQNARLASLEAQCAQLRQEKAKHLALLEMERSKLDGLTDAKNNEVGHLEAQKAKLEQEKQEAKKERLMLESQLEMERMKVESEKKKLMMTHEQLRDKELQLSQLSMSSSMMSNSMSASIMSSSSTTVPDTGAGVTDPAMLGSMSSSMHNSMSSGSLMSQVSSQDDLLERALMQGGGASSNLSRLNLYESLRSAGATSLLENLQSQLKQREGEVHQLQSEIVELEKTREAMARELVNLSNQCDELKEELKDYPAFKKEYSDLDKRYNAMLQMYGEKVEEADELRLDLQDVKDMYKGQIEELLKSRF